MTAQRILLAMIVKDEAHVIRRCLDSVRPFVHYGVIVDTGSTDGTQDVIRAWVAENGLPIEVHDRPWVDFAHNRTEVFELARAHGDYVISTGADERLVADPGFRMPALTADSYFLFVHEAHRGGVDTWRREMLSTAVPWRYVHRIHEYPVAEGATSGDLPGLRIIAGADGARACDPLTVRRDLELAEREHDEHPSDPRWHMYVVWLALAAAKQSTDPLEARRFLDRAVEVGERVTLMPAVDYWAPGGECAYWALLFSAEARARRGDPRGAVIGDLLAAYELAPWRAEALRELAGRCRGWENEALASHIDDVADTLPMPGPDRAVAVNALAYQGVRITVGSDRSEEQRT